MKKQRVGVLSLSVLSLCLVAVGADPAAGQKKKKNRGGPTSGALDEGRLVVSWFGEAMEFRETGEIDYLWVKEGWDLDGRTLHFVEWPEHEFQGPKANERDENDHRLARQMTAEMARSFADTFNRNFPGSLKSSNDDGEIEVSGRVVDCSTGSTAAKVLVGFGAGAGNTTIDVKFIDKASGQLVAAFHHRVVSGTNWSTTDSKFFKWVRKMGKELDKKGFYGAYRSGDRRRQ